MQTSRQISGQTVRHMLSTVKFVHRMSRLLSFKLTTSCYPKGLFQYLKWLHDATVHPLKFAQLIKVQAPLLMYFIFILLFYFARCSSLCNTVYIIIMKLTYNLTFWACRASVLFDVLNTVLYIQTSLKYSLIYVTDWT